MLKTEVYRFSQNNYRLFIWLFCNQVLHFPQQTSLVQSSPSRKNPTFTTLQVPMKLLNDFFFLIVYVFSVKTMMRVYIIYLTWWFDNIVSSVLFPQNCLTSKAHSSPTPHYPHQLRQAQVNDLNLNCPKSNPKSGLLLVSFHIKKYYAGTMAWGLCLWVIPW